VEPWFWENLCSAIGRDDLKKFSFTPDHFTQDRPDESWHRATEEVGKVFLSKTRDEWFDILCKHDVPVGKVYEIDEVAADPQLQHRKMVLEFDHPKLGKVRQPGIAIKLSQTPGNVRSMAPYSGENTDEVMKSLGYSMQVIESLRKANAIG
jgi:CoA:oxalate CoA-transferase